jgi:hypothetical protein
MSTLRVLDCDAGSSDKTFQNGLIRDRDESGLHVLPNRLTADGRGGTRGMRLAALSRAAVHVSLD